MGITRDAENDAKAARDSVAGAIKSAGIRSSVQIIPLILPDDKEPGMIETLCLRSLADSAILKCVDKFFTCVESSGKSLPTGPILAKHRAQAFLSTVDGPQPFVGVAGYKGHWPYSHEAFAHIKKFLMAICPNK